MIQVNYLAILASVVLSAILGTIWYGPLFGKLWSKLEGWTKADMEKGAADKAKMMRSYGIQFVGSFFMAFVMSRAIIFEKAYLHDAGLSVGLMTGFHSWLGFIVPATLTSVLWEGKPWKLWFLINGYWLLLSLSMGVLLSLWV